MDISLQLANYLQRAGFGTVGTNIFAGQIPDNTNGLWVVHSGGLRGKYIPIDETVVDIYCKDTSAADCINLITDVSNFIHRSHTTSINDAYIYSMLVIGNVEDVSRDLEYAKIYKITVELIVRDTSIIS